MKMSDDMFTADHEHKDRHTTIAYSALVYNALCGKKNLCAYHLINRPTVTGSQSRPSIIEKNMLKDSYESF